jgi:AhpD family alkylhydroperoxidase
MRGQIDPSFRERLMLAVTAVNGCRYCSYFHARQALTSGITQEEIAALGDGVIDRAPPDEVPALLYAQRWAETSARAEPAARARLVETYGDEVAEGIEIVLRMIRAGNLMGNTWDYVLYRISGGRWGGKSPTPTARAEG